MWAKRAMRNAPVDFMECRAAPTCRRADCSWLMFADVFAHGFAFAAHVVEHQLAHCLAVTAAQRVDDGFMLAHRVAQTVAVNEICRVSQPPDDGVRGRVVRTQEWIGGGIHDSLMNLLVQAEIIRELMPQIVGIHFQMHAFDRGDVLVRNALAGGAPGDEVESGDQLKEIADVGFGKLAHARAAVGKKLDQPF